jgi:nitrogenase iron protein
LPKHSAAAEAVGTEKTVYSFIMKIAIYGKGGIGKSTIAANISAALAEGGCRVLQIGCDPKHDSTRLLLNGRIVTTALDYMRNVAPAEQRLDELLHTGYGGVSCAEAGGPEPGVGCAGRGILSTFALFDRLGLQMDYFDVVLYDVLGDVVCGGFAVPLRKGFADVVYIVTSEEYMAIYAANNILRGIANFDAGAFRLAGLILNSRGDGEDDAPVERFAKAARVPLMCRIPRSDRFRRAEEKNQTVIEAFPQSPESMILRQLASEMKRSRRLYPAKPLSDSDLEQIVFRKTSSYSEQTAGPTQIARVPAKPIKAAKPQAQDPPQASIGLMSKSMLFREPLHGCAFAGAISTTTQIRDAVTVAHGPRSCAHIAARTILSSGIRTRSRKGAILPRQLAPDVISSDMNEGVMIYGGGETLRETLRKALARRPKALFVVTACPSGVIGDDPLAAIREVRREYPDIPILPVTSDGNIHGDYMQGVINACLEGAAALIDPLVAPEKNCVNILAEKNIANNAESNYTTVSEMLDAMGIRINCRFIRDTSVATLRRFQKASLNLLAYEDHFGRLLKSFFAERTGAVFSAYPFPVGFKETRRWLKDIGAFFDKSDRADQLTESYESGYESAIRRLAPYLAGKRLMIVSFIHDVDWILETAFDLGMGVEKVGILNFSQDHIFRTRFADRFACETGYTPEKRDRDLSRIQPDLLLSNYVPEKLPAAIHADSIPLCPDVGFYGGLRFARRWAALLKSPVREGWRDDEVADA